MTCLRGEAYNKITTILQVVVTEIVEDNTPGFYTHLFPVEKASSRWRPDLSVLNLLLHQMLTMEMPQSVLVLIREGGFMVLMGRQGVYLHKPLHTSYRNYMQFVSQDMMYCTVLV